jgi:hypothetical protein
VASFSSSDILIVIAIVVFLAFCSYFLVDMRVQDKTVALNFSKGVKNIVTAVNGSSISTTLPNSTMTIVTRSTVTTSSTTTSTIRILFLDSGNIAASAISSSGGNIFINCGTNISIADRLYFNDINSINTAIITKTDSDHMSVCAHMFMLVPPSVVFDSGGFSSDDYYSNYMVSVGNKRRTLEKGDAFVVGDIYGSIISSDSVSTSILFKYKNMTYIYADGCDDKCLSVILPKNKNVDVLFLVNSGEISDERMQTLLPLFFAVKNVSAVTMQRAQKYGIKIWDIGSKGDFEVDSNGYWVEWKKTNGI